MVQDQEERSAVGAALEWVSRILAVSAEMVLPGLAGKWLDDRWGTGFLALLGFALGISLAIWHLLVMTRRPSPGKRSGSESDDN